jgi:hypothetical protein
LVTPFCNDVKDQAEGRDTSQHHGNVVCQVQAVFTSQYYIFGVQYILIIVGIQL